MDKCLEFYGESSRVDVLGHPDERCLVVDGPIIGQVKQAFPSFQRYEHRECDGGAGWQVQTIHSDPGNCHVHLIIESQDLSERLFLAEILFSQRPGEDDGTGLVKQSCSVTSQEGKVEKRHKIRIDTEDLILKKSSLSGIDDDPPRLVETGCLFDLRDFLLQRGREWRGNKSEMVFLLVGRGKSLDDAVYAVHILMKRIDTSGPVIYSKEKEEDTEAEAQPGYGDQSVHPLLADSSPSGFKVIQ